MFNCLQESLFINRDPRFGAQHLCNWCCFDVRIPFFSIRGWDQFEANATLFGVKSTFNEELYTTKLEKGPQMRELEKEAMRIAREIEGEDTGDLHLAEVSLSFDLYL